MSKPATHSDVWRPIRDETIAKEVAHNYQDGVALDSLALRAKLSGKDEVYLRVVRAEIDLYPDNATLMAAFARGLSVYRNGVVYYGEETRPSMPRAFSSENIREWIEKAKQKQPTCWLAYVAECEWIPGSGYGQPSKIRTVAAEAARHAFALEENAVTTSTLVWALCHQAWTEHKVPLLQEAADFVHVAEQRYQGNVKVDTQLYQFYSFVPMYVDEKKGKKYLDSLVATIPSELRSTPSVVNYLHWNNWANKR